jgi:hypothetical protein
MGQDKIYGWSAQDGYFRVRMVGDVPVPWLKIQMYHNARIFQVLQLDYSQLSKEKGGADVSPVYEECMRSRQLVPV